MDFYVGLVEGVTPDTLHSMTSSRDLWTQPRFQAIWNPWVSLIVMVRGQMGQRWCGGEGNGVGCDLS